MGRITRQYVESICEFWNFKLIRHEISENRKRPLICYSVVDGGGNFLTREKDLNWCLMVVNTYLHNTKDLGMQTWICPACKQINFNNQTCMECQKQR